MRTGIDRIKAPLNCEKSLLGFHLLLSVKPGPVPANCRPRKTSETKNRALTVTLICLLRTDAVVAPTFPDWKIALLQKFLQLQFW